MSLLIIFYFRMDNETTTEFNLTDKDFPACKFARVKSYTAESYAALQSRPI